MTGIEPIYLAYASAAAGAAGAGASIKSSIDQKSAAKKSQRVTQAATAKQAEREKQQQALLRRDALVEEGRAEDLSGQLARRRRAVAARSRGRGSLAFTAPNAGLKTKLGG